MHIYDIIVTEIASKNYMRLLHFAQWITTFSSTIFYVYISGGKDMPINRYALGERIYESRKNRKLTQSDLAELAGISNTYLSHIENGSKNMSMDTFIDICNALGATADELLIDNIISSDLKLGDKMTELMNGCSIYEKKVVLDVVEALKKSLMTYKK